MEAVSFIAPKKVEIVDIPQPQMGTEDVLIQIHYIGLCGTDLNSYRGLMPLVTYPRIPGHEISGLIVDKGTQVPASLTIGERVMLSPYSHCGLCPACRVGRFNCCQFNQTLGVQRDGGMTRQVALHYSKVFANSSLSLPELALVEPLSVGYHAANRGRVTEVDMVLVLGCGAVGIGVIAAAARKGATVIAVDVDESKLAMAQKFGAQYTVNSVQQDVLATVQALTNGEGVNVAIEAVGLPETFRQAVEVAAFAGRVVYIGYAKKEVSFDTSLFVRKELDVLGSRNALHVFPAVIKMLEQRLFPFADLISQVYPLAEAARAFHDWDAAPGQFTKIMIEVEGGGTK